MSGLAATQVDVHERVLVLDVSQERNEPLALVNPEILTRDGVAEGEEGCLSVPGISTGRPCGADHGSRAGSRRQACSSSRPRGLLAVCIQHEMDHLEGKLFVDYLSELKRTRIRKKLEERASRARRRRTRARAAPSPVI